MHEPRRQLSGAESVDQLYWKVTKEDLDGKLVCASSLRGKEPKLRITPVLYYCIIECESASKAYVYKPSIFGLDMTRRPPVTGPTATKRRIYHSGSHSARNFMDSAQHSTHSSTSSAIELALGSAGIGPGSPSLAPSADGRNSFTRRRLSWGRVDSGQDPLRPDPDLFAMNDPGPSSRPSLSSQVSPAYAVDDDPFVSHTQMDSFRVSTATSDYGVYTNHPRAGTSTASLISSRRQSSTSTFDDSVHLTANITSEPTDGGNWRTDSEHIAAATPRTRRRTQRSELTPLSRSGTTIKSISQGLRRISVRVVNFAGSSLEDEDRVRLGSDDGEERVAEGDDEGVVKVDESLPDPSSLPLRGRTLVFFGPTNRVRVAMYEFLIFPCVAFLLGARGTPDCRTGGQKSSFFVQFFFMPLC